MNKSGLILEGLRVSRVNEENSKPFMSKEVSEALIKELESKYKFKDVQFIQTPQGYDPNKGGYFRISVAGVVPVDVFNKLRKNIDVKLHDFIYKKFNIQELVYVRKFFKTFSVHSTEYKSPNKYTQSPDEYAVVVSVDGEFGDTGGQQK
jgi:hypothetical protein